jgi:hypothetical protein
MKRPLKFYRRKLSISSEKKSAQTRKKKDKKENDVIIYLTPSIHREFYLFVRLLKKNGNSNF